MNHWQRCVWCGERLDDAGAHRHKPFCRECADTYEREKQRPYHLPEERVPYTD